MTPTPEKKHYLDLNKDNLHSQQELLDALKDKNNRVQMVQDLEKKDSSDWTKLQDMLPLCEDILHDLFYNKKEDVNALINSYDAKTATRNKTENAYFGVLYLYAKIKGISAEKGEDNVTFLKRIRDTFFKNEQEIINKNKQEKEIKATVAQKVPEGFTQENQNIVDTKKTPEVKEQQEKPFEQILEDNLNPENHLFFEMGDDIVVVQKQNASEYSKKIATLEKNMGKQAAVAAVDLFLEDAEKRGKVRSVRDVYMNALQNSKDRSGNILISDISDEKILQNYKNGHKEQQITYIRSRDGSSLLKALTQFDFARVKEKNISAREHVINTTNLKDLVEKQGYEAHTLDPQKDAKDIGVSEADLQKQSKDMPLGIKKMGNIILYKNEKGEVQIFTKKTDNVDKPYLWKLLILNNVLWISGLIINNNKAGIEKGFSHFRGEIGKVFDGLGKGIKNLFTSTPTPTFEQPNNVIIGDGGHKWDWLKDWIAKNPNKTPDFPTNNIKPEEHVGKILNINTFRAGALIGAMATSIPLKMKIARMEKQIAKGEARFENTHSLKGELITSDLKAEEIVDLFNDEDKVGETSGLLSNIESNKNAEANEIGHAMLVKSGVFKFGEILSLGVTSIKKTDTGFEVALGAGEGKGNFVYGGKRFELKKGASLTVNIPYVDGKFGKGTFKDEKIFKRWFLGKSRSIEDVKARVDGKETSKQAKAEKKNTKQKIDSSEKNVLENEYNKTK